MSKNYRVIAQPRAGIWQYEPRSNSSRPLSVERAVAIRMKSLEHGTFNRIRMVPGFYNTSLTAEVARSALPALYVDFNCDLFVSTVQAQRWMFEHRLLRPGAIISYDDWFNAPFGAGESLAHMEVANEFKVEYKHLSAGLWLGPGPCKLVYFRVQSVGVRAHAGITSVINHTGRGFWNR